MQGAGCSLWVKGVGFEGTHAVLNEAAVRIEEIEEFVGIDAL